jgi:hypothetical protein
VYSREKLLLQEEEEGVCHTLTLPFTFKNLSMLRQKKNYEKKNSNIFHHAKNIIFKKNPLKEKKPKAFKVLLL